MDKFMQAAIEEAEKGLAEDGIPIGSVIVHKGKIIGRGTIADPKKKWQSFTVMVALENAGKTTRFCLQRLCLIHNAFALFHVLRRQILLYAIPKGSSLAKQHFMGEEGLLRSRGLKLQVLQDEGAFGMMTKFVRETPHVVGMKISAV